MKILSRKQQNEILKRVAACQIICNKYINDIEAFDKMTENLSDIAVTIDFWNGADKVINTVHKYNE